MPSVLPFTVLQLAEAAPVAHSLPPAFHLLGSKFATSSFPVHSEILSYVCDRQHWHLTTNQLVVGSPRPHLAKGV
jgi:hypothetical protein